MADLPPLPPRKTDQPRQLPPRPATAINRADARPAKPDPRPMRVVYGAGAVAVASVMAVGLVQPDFTATADQQATNDPNATDANAGQDAANVNAGNGNGNGQGRNDQSGNGSAQAAPQVQHVTKYIHLKPGQTAPPGATVITPGQPTPKIVVATKPGPGPTQPPANHNPNPPPNNPPPANNPPPTHQPPPPPPPPPTPRPTVKTHQSGHP